MKRLLSLLGSLILVASAGSVLAASPSSSVGGDEVQKVQAGPGVLLQSSHSNQSVRFKVAGVQDTFPLYGGPAQILDNDPGDGPWPNPRPVNEGKFQDVNGILPDMQGWTGVDLTDQPVHWQISDFNAGNLNGHGVGNQAYWCGQSAAQQPGWAGGAGYGNGWNDILIFQGWVPADPAVGQTVGLDFFFNHDSEPGYDFFTVEYDSAGFWKQIYSKDGSNKDASGVFQAPGVQFSSVATGSVVYGGNDYSTDGTIRIRLRFQSDGAWSDEDGLWPTMGAVQVDDISVTWDAGSTLDTFEGAGPFNWAPDRSPFVGDFVGVFARISDTDPCRDNNTPVLGFIDYGQEPPNGPGVNGATSTGGSLGSTTYGIPGNWVVNYTGGLTFGLLELENEAWSPEFDWDVPGTADDDPAVSGSYLRFSNWVHLPLANGIFWVWHVRSKVAGGVYTNWRDRNFVHYGSPSGEWQNIRQETTDLIESGPEKVQVALGVTDLADLFGFPGVDATPSPVFDNVAFFKYRIEGATIATRTIDLANDGFPVNGSIDVSTPAAAGALDIPFDMARDVNSGGVVIDPGDSIIADVTAVIPGTTVADVRMVWVLDKNPFFDSYRVAPSGRIGSFGGPKDVNVDTASDPNRWFGEVLADTSRTSAGSVVARRFFFDLPDVDFMYPGDVLRYYIQATDSDGRVTTLPGNTNGFATGVDAVTGETYNRTFVVRGLPSLVDAAGTQPSKLIWNDFGRRGGENEFLSAMGQLGFVEGVDYDTYTTQGPSSGVSNGLGSAGAHGANADQLAGYDTIVYLAGDLSSLLLSDGSNFGNGSNNDKSNDLALMTGWKDRVGVRNTVYFGDYIASALVLGSAAGGTYLSTVMGVGLTDDDVRDEIGFQTAPVVAPAPGAPAQFVSSYVAFGGCLGINQFDSIFPLASSIAGHEFLDPDRVSGAYAPAASVIFDRLANGTERKVDVTFPYSLLFVYDDNANKAPVATSARTKLLEEVFDYFGVTSGNAGQATGNPSALRKADLAVFPNPFNPKTTIRFTNPAKGSASVKVYNVKGELVRTLFSGELDAGTYPFEWNGVDNRGASVASGVYIIEAQAGSHSLSQKAMLVK